MSLNPIPQWVAGISRISKIPENFPDSWFSWISNKHYPLVVFFIHVFFIFSLIIRVRGGEILQICLFCLFNWYPEICINKHTAPAYCLFAYCLSYLHIPTGWEFVPDHRRRFRRGNETLSHVSMSPIIFYEKWVCHRVWAGSIRHRQIPQWVGRPCLLLWVSERPIFDTVPLSS